MKTINNLALLAFIAWSGICGLGAAAGLFGVITKEFKNPTITGADPYASTGATIGTVLGLGIIFAVWMFGAVPSFMVWMFTRIDKPAPSSHTVQK